ncbi:MULTISPECIES: response regulator transcription factor [unclassified Nocardiopsis]|uniref:response regulator transcription factor n=1 Tax=Nocardiopsis TaxID=2013 RepID=UPI00387A866E
MVEKNCGVARSGPPVLVVADCEGCDEILKDLRRHGFSRELVSTGAEAISRYEEFQLVLVDLDLEDFDGLTLCREIRKASDIPMIGFTSSEMNRILALEGGCDDCIDKPYSSREFMARITALLRRSRVSSSSALAFGELSIHPTTREVRVGDRSVKATRKEFELLHLLASNSDSLFSRAELLRRVWQFNVVQDEVTPLASRTIDTHVSSLRKKLGAPDWIVTVRGVGFRFNAPDASYESS